jgi:hypothetical protein
MNRNAGKGISAVLVFFFIITAGAAGKLSAGNPACLKQPGCRPLTLPTRHRVSYNSQYMHLHSPVQLPVSGSSEMIA